MSAPQLKSICREMGTAILANAHDKREWGVALLQFFTPLGRKGALRALGIDDIPRRVWRAGDTIDDGTYFPGPRRDMFSRICKIRGGSHQRGSPTRAGKTIGVGTYVPGARRGIFSRI